MLHESKCDRFILSDEVVSEHNEPDCPVCIATPSFNDGVQACISWFLGRRFPATGFPFYIRELEKLKVAK